METTLRAALIDWLRADPILGNLINTVTEEAPSRTAAPWLAIAASASADWSTKDRTGREVRVAHELHCRGDDPGSAANGGDLGFFQQGQMVGPFNDAAFTLAPGTTSELVETDFGFHIIKVVEKKEGRTIPLEEVKPQVEQYLERLNRQQQTDAFVNGLKAKGKIEILI